MTTLSIPRRGEVWIVDLDPTRGAEMRKQRTAVVMSRDDLARLQIHIIVPITGWQPSFATLAWFQRLAPTARNGLSKESGADALQIRSVSRERFIRKIGVLNAGELDEIAYRAALCVGVKPF